MEVLDAPGLQQRLRGAGILPTLQRLTIAGVLLNKPVHMTADQVLEAARVRLSGVSRATVYSVLQMFVRHGLLKELPIDGAATVYDSNTGPHHHLYDINTGEVADLPHDQLQVLGLPQALSGLELAGVDVIVRVRGLAGRAAASSEPVVG
jgi:Fur family iron response transcriptional regulator